MELKEAQRKAALPKSKLQLRRIEESKEIKAHGKYYELVRWRGLYISYMQKQQYVASSAI